MKKITITLCSVLLIFSLISCGSKPEPEMEKEPEAPVIEQVKEEPVVTEETSKKEPEAPKADNTQALAKIEDSRNAAIQAGADKDAEEEFKKLDAMYEELKKRSDADEDISKESIERIAIFQV